MALLEMIYDKLKDTLGPEMAVKAICIGSGTMALGLGVSLIAIASMCKQPQPIIILNTEIQNN